MVLEGRIDTGGDERWDDGKALEEVADDVEKIADDVDKSADDVLDKAFELLEVELELDSEVVDSTATLELL